MPHLTSTRIPEDKKKRRDKTWSVTPFERLRCSNSKRNVSFSNIPHPSLWRKPF